MSGASSALAGVDIFQGVDQKDLRRLESRGRRRRFEAGEVLLQEGETAIALFAVLSGRVRVTQRTADGQERELRTIGPGGTFGEMALFTDWARRSATITAIEPTECLVLHRFDFLDQLRQDPEIAIHLLETLGRRLVEAERRA